VADTASRRRRRRRCRRSLPKVIRVSLPTHKSRKCILRSCIGRRIETLSSAFIVDDRVVRVRLPPSFSSSFVAPPTRPPAA
jgi:hypothetical protein